MTKTQLLKRKRLLGLGMVLAATIGASAQTSLTPSSVTVNAGKTYQFSLSVDSSLTPSTASIQWSIWPPLGTITNSGLYTAPASVTAIQNTKVVVLIIPASTSISPVVLHSNVTVAPPVAVSVSPATAAAGPSGTVQLTASVANSSNSAVTWKVSPALGTVSSSGFYTAPATIASSTTVAVTATSAADSTKSASATITLNTPSVSTVLLPIEVMGANGTTKSVQVTVPSNSALSGPLNLWLQIHGLEYQTQASVQVNSGAWIPINSQNVTLQGLAGNYGGIGGGFTTLSMTVSLPAGLVQVGVNTINFMFNGTDGNSSGYRVLALNIQEPNGTQLVPSTAFAQDNPANWTIPLNDSADIAAGQTLWQTAAITQPVPGSSPKSLQAHCGDCHTHDGRDLKYFNYSNNAIETRAAFHGLGSTQAAQIASYIRSLSTPAPATAAPWNPPYQPGPGLDSQPVTNWAAGAGINNVVASDAAMLPYVSPTLTAADFNPNNNLSARQVPLSIPLPDWNHWLPQIHPVDFPDSNFLQSIPYQDYLTLQAGLVPNSVSAYNNMKYRLASWVSDRVVYQQSLTPSASSSAWSQPSTAKGLYGISLWQMVKNWELNQVNGLEGMAQSAFGPQADPRAWYSTGPFTTAPSFMSIPDNAPGILNGTVAASTSLSFDWYYLQLVLNDGQKNSQCGSSPVDWGYFRGAVTVLSEHNSGPQSSVLLMILLKALQVSQNGLGPQYGCSGGWNPSSSVPASLVQLENSQIWNQTSAANRSALLNAYTSSWFAVASAFTPQEFYNGGWITPSDPISPGNPNANFASAIAYMIPHMQYWGLNSTVAQSIAKWAATMWPSNNYNWAATTSATCSTNASGIAICSTDF